MQIIETERLILRPFREGDAADLFAYLRAPTAPCFLSLKLSDLAQAEAEVRKRAVDEGSVAICLKETGQVIGDLFGGAGDEEEDGTASVGWHLNPQFGGRGYAFEAAKALFDHLFRVMGFRRLYAYVEDHNTPSQRLCEKLGMRREGVFIEFVSFTNDDAGNPIYENTMQYAILRREWMSGASAV
ncbi:GNAT family N-acetyltransferase [Sphingosinicella microcystinivorans]|uniref:N-acetyltransferase GCN5 n=1 Tax=Sphingosinicella microcystinivorans TaxID=335406 RepID=A0AAD1G008_SPHMI|nr:GNAT family protein [Sphingosinicella microcystinivorans]RKS84575.1 RimJ/RimL family protein N-acetyltransferase [Sphingosinicella microcystinivorans]BBE33026.1 N-acetyltransferase GCN5 [Sphingosinicella microcystinivorans]